MGSPVNEKQTSGWGLSSMIPSIIPASVEDAINKTCSEIQAVVKDPQTFTYKGTKGILEAISTSSISSNKSPSFIGKHVQAIDLSPKDQDFLDQLKSGNSSNLSEILKTLRQYHLIVFGAREFSPSSNISSESPVENESFDPNIISENQHAMREIRRTYLSDVENDTCEQNEPESSGMSKTIESETINEVQKITNEMVSSICEKLIDAIASGRLNPSAKSIETKSRGFFYKFYHAMIHAMISHSSQELVKVLRKSKEALQDGNFIEKHMFSPLNSYFASVENARIHFVKTQGNLETETFRDLLKARLQTFSTGNRPFTQKELIENFETFLSLHCVPRPKAPIYIPFFSSFFEKIIWKLKQKIFAYYLNKTNLVENLLNQCVENTDLHLKILEKALTEIVTSLHQFKPPESISDMRPSVKIERTLDLAIAEFAPNFFKFCDIVSANENPRTLQELDQHKFEDLILSLSFLFPSAKTLSLQTTFANSAAQILRLIVEKMRATGEKTIETHIQEFAQQLGKNLDSLERKTSLDHKRKAQIDDETKISSLISEISDTAVQRAHNTHQREVMGERHKRIKAYAEHVKNRMLIFSKESDQAALDFLKSQNPINYLSKIVSLTESLLNEAHSITKSPDLKECYIDVRENIQEALRKTLDKLTKLNLSQIGELNLKLKKNNQEIFAIDRINRAVSNLSPATPFYEIQETICQITKNFNELSDNLKLNLINEFERLILPLEELKKEQSLSSLKRETIKNNATLREIDLVNDRIELLKPLLQQYHKYSTNQVIEKPLQEIKQEISEIISDLDQIKTNELKALISKFINLSGTNEMLYQNFFPSWSFFPMPSLIDSLSEMRNRFDRNLKSNEQKVIDLSKYSQSKAWSSIGQILTTTSNLLIDENKKINQERVILQSELQKVVLKNQTEFQSIQSISEQIDVKGCVYLFKLNSLEKALAENITSKIENYLVALTDALKDPFHLKQLILRIVFVPIAENLNSK